MKILYIDPDSQLGEFSWNYNGSFAAGDNAAKFETTGAELVETGSVIFGVT